MITDDYESARSSVKIIVETSPIIVGLFGVLVLIITQAYEKLIFYQALPYIYSLIVLSILVSVFSFALTYLFKFRTSLLAISAIATIIALFGGLSFIAIEMILNGYVLYGSIIEVIGETFSLSYLFVILRSLYKNAPILMIGAIVAVIIFEVGLFIFIIFTSANQQALQITINAITQNSIK